MTHNSYLTCGEINLRFVEFYVVYIADLKSQICFENKILILKLFVFFQIRFI